MKLKRWQAGLFAMSIIWGLIGTAIVMSAFPRRSNGVQTIIMNSDSNGPHLTGQILNPKYDTALRNRLSAGVGENEILDVIIVLDQQNPQWKAARNAIQSVGGVIDYEYHLFQGLLAAIPATSLSVLAGFPAVLRICDDSIETLPQDSTPTPALADTNNWWRSAVGANGVSQTGTGVKIAILDTGLGYLSTPGSLTYHEDFPTSRIWAAKNFGNEDGVVDPTYTYDWFGHGTHTAGIALGSGVASSGSKYKGIAPDAQLLVGRVLNSSGGGETSDILKGIEWAVDNGAQIISMSLGGNDPGDFTPDALAVQNATEHGALVVASAGNSGPDYFSGGTPGTALYTLSVAASDRNNKLADFSSVGPTFEMQSFPSLTAPGVDIIAPLGINSIIEKEEVYVEEVITGTSGSDYVPLSGTSMSAPMVAGGAALLLQQYSTANPLTLRIAMMESAVDLNVAPVRQGSGLLNVAGAFVTLADVATTGNVNNVTRVYPKQLPFEPYDLLQFPGDAQTMNLTVFSGIARNISIQLPDLTSEGIQLSTSQPVLNFTKAGAKLWNLTVSVDWNASVGVKSGLIKFIDGTNGETLDEVALNLTITLPKRRVYFDSFHGLNDYFNAVYYGTTQFEMYNLAKGFTAKNYSVDLKMESWTPGYMPDRDGRLLTYDLLQNYDAVVLQTPSLPYTSTEVQALVDFRARNGSILIIGDRYQSLTLDSVNNLLSRLGTGISFLPKNLEYIQFYGAFGLTSNLLFTPSSPKDPMLSGVQALLFHWGALLQTSGTGMSVLNATSSGLTITAAAKSTGPGGMGNVVVLSGPSLLTNTYMTDATYGGNHTHFASNIVDYLLPEKSFNIARQVTPERSTNGITKTYLYVTNGSTGLPVTDLVGGVDINLTSSNLAIPGVVDFVNVTEQASGIYVNNSYTLGPANLSPYFLNASASVSGLVRNSSAAAIRTDSSPPEFFNYSQDKNNIARTGNDSVTLQTLHLQSAVALDFIYAYCGSTPASAFNTRPQYSFNISLGGTFPAEYKTPSFNAKGKTSGIYAYFFEGNNSAGYTNVHSIREGFEVTNVDPVINEANSYFGQLPFSSLKTDEGYYIQNAQQGNTYTFDVTATDTEDLDNQLTGVVAFIPVYQLNNSIGFLIMSEDLPVKDLSYAASTGMLSGEIQIPLTLLTLKGDGTYLLKSTASSGDYLAVFEVAVMDTDGGNTDYIVIMQVEPYLDILLVVLIIVAIAAGVGVTAFLLYRRHRARILGTETPYRYRSAYETSTEAGYGYAPDGQKAPPTGSLRKFCLYCGQPIPIEANKCPYCGANIPPMDGR